MRTILISEICNEKPNSSALGAFNSAIDKGGRISQSFGEKEAVGFWKYNMIKGVQEGNNKEYALAIGAYRNLQKRGILSK